MGAQDGECPSAAEIRRRYFGEAGAENDGSGPGRRAELTPAARYVVSSAKKRLAQGESEARLDEDQLFMLLRAVEEAEGEKLSDRERTAAVAAIASSLDDYDVLTPLIENPAINDIIIRNYRDVSVQIGRRNVHCDLQWPDHASYCAFVENLLKRAGKACTVATPVVDAAFSHGVRICVTHQSFSPEGSGPMLTVRIARHTNVSCEGLERSGLAPPVIFAYLGALVRSGCATLLIAGEVGTGKTTLVKALAAHIRQEEAVLIIEDTHELALRRPFTRTLLTREANTEGAGRISPAAAIRTGMRMAMNRIILGEMRDAESAEAFVDVCASGHAGMSTIHARNARDALLRLELFLLRAQGTVNVDTVRRQIANSISVVVFLGLDRRERIRRIFNVVEVGAAADGAVQLSPMFAVSERAGRCSWIREPGVSLFGDLLSEAGLELPLPGTVLHEEDTP